MKQGSVLVVLLLSLFLLLSACGPPAERPEGAVARPVIGPHPAETSQRDIRVLADALGYYSTGEARYLRKILSDEREQPSRYLGIVELAASVVNRRAPKSDLGKARLAYLLSVPGRLHQCLWMKTPEESRDQVHALKPADAGMPSDLYVEGLFKLVRCPATPVGELRKETQALSLKKGEAVADIGFGSGQHVFALAREVGASGKATGIEISPFLVDYLNFAAGALNLPQLEGRLGGHTDILVPEHTLDAVFIRHVFSNLREAAQPWVRSIFLAMKPGGRMLILQHYSPKEVAAHRAMIDAFIAGGDFPVAERIPCRLKSPEVVSRLCAKVGFEVVSVQENIAPDHVYALRVRKP